MRRRKPLPMSIRPSRCHAAPIFPASPRSATQRRTKNATAQVSANLHWLTQRPIELAVDTEYQATQSLTVQFAGRDLQGTLNLKLYRAPTIPRLADFKFGNYKAGIPSGVLGDWRRRSSGLLTPDRSPARILVDLFNLKGVRPVSRLDGYERLRNQALDLPGGTWSGTSRRWRIPEVDVVLVGHFLPADLARAFGPTFYEDIFQQSPHAPRIHLTGTRRLALVTAGRVPDHRPIVEFVETQDGHLYAVRMRTLDTLCPFGPGSLERLSQTFLRTGKFPGFTPEEKGRMLEMFRRRTSDAYGYAYRDAALTLLVYEQMKVRDRAIYTSLEIPEAIDAPMRPTVGGRVSGFLVAATRQFASGSKKLAEERHLKALMAAGGIQRFAKGADGSHFGEQTGAVHGGLLFNRTPTRLWHEAPGLLRDVDMRACYSETLQRKNVYWGRPVVLEPGARHTRLGQGVRFVRRYADEDAWFIRVTGDIKAMPNALIPSTLDAITNKNYRRRRRTANASAIQRRADGPRFRAKLFSQRIESGVITSDTWQVIQALPPSSRREFEDLSVDSIVFYPRSLVAKSGAEYDQKFDQVHIDCLPWRARIDPEMRHVVETTTLDHEYVALRFPIDSYARRIEEFRREARWREGSGSGEERAWKLQVNSMFGVLASERCAANNVVLANQITAQARAEAFILTMSLNALQVITDGCLYRRDRIPSCTLEECLRRQPDYPLRHADESSGIPFHNPPKIPDDDVRFMKWFAQHVQKFLGQSRDTTGRILVHQLEHKRTGTTESPAFDALVCDGSGNHIKVIKSEVSRLIQEAKMRGFGDDSKVVLAPWIVETCASDKLTAMAPLTRDRCLLKLAPATKAALIALRNRGNDSVLLPLGFEKVQTKAYSILKPSAFILQTPRQFAAIERQVEKLRQATGCGLDQLALRGRYDGQPSGSLSDRAAQLYVYFNAGGKDLSKAFNLRPCRWSRTIAEQIQRRRRTLDRARDQARRVLEASIVVKEDRACASAPGIILTRETVQQLMLENT
jgi:hypothetical protein